MFFVIFPLLLTTFKVITCEDILQQAFEDLIDGLEDAWNSNKERQCDTLLYNSNDTNDIITSHYANNRQLVLRSDLPPRTSPLPAWYYDAWVLRRISWCIVAVVKVKRGQGQSISYLELA